jgi:hypothetical protein
MAIAILSPSFAIREAVSPGKACSHRVRTMEMHVQGLILQGRQYPLS